MHIKQIDITRFIGVLSVVIFHYGRDVYPFNQFIVDKLFLGGPIAVSYFFTLSGFILAYVYYNNKNDINSIRFYIARFARIYPMYFLSLMPFIIHTLRKGDIDYNSIMLHLFMLQSFLPIKLTLYNIPSWAVSVEVAFYVLFPLLMKYIFRYGKKSFLNISIVFWISSQILLIYLLNNVNNGSSLSVFDISYNNSLFHLNSFILGVAIGAYFKEVISSLSIKKSVNLGMLLLSFLSILSIILMQEHIPDVVGFKVPLSYGLLTPLFLAFICTLSLDNSLLTGFLKNNLFIKLGEASYCIFIFQAPFNYFYYYYIGKTWNFSTNQTFYLYVLILILISACFFKFIELPLRNRIMYYYKNNQSQMRA